MKKLTIVLLLMSCMAGSLAKAVSRNGNLAAADYDDILKYVIRVEKGGFQPADFEKFAVERKVMIKNVLIMGAIEEDLYWVSLIFLAASTSIVFLKWPKNPSRNI